MDLVEYTPIIFMGFIVFSIFTMLFILTSFLSSLTKMINRPYYPPVPEVPPPQPIRVPTPEPVNDIPPADDGLSLEDFIPDLSKPVKVVVKEDEHGNIIEGK